jgi:pimeloyl-ACP methyl ester carboxylesterase
MLMNMNPPAIVETLKVPGASLYYEKRGSGPVLLMIPGGPADAGVFSALAGILADKYTVVTYDPRGNSRSTLDGPPEDWRAEVHADDASLLLSKLATEPAYVFGSSGGAQVGLALAVRHPEQVRVLVAHEPPAMELLGDRGQRRALTDEIYEIYRREGAGPAMGRFMANAGLKPPPSRPGGEAPPEAAQAMTRMGKNVELFLAHGLRTIAGYVPDVAALRRGSARVVMAGGEESRGTPAYEAGAALAQQLGTTLVHFPGDHGGFGQHAPRFAETLDTALRGR